MILADTQAIAVMTSRTPATIRSWAHRGLIQRRGTGRRGIALYSVEDAEALIDKQRHGVQRSEALRDFTP